jgi:hypothetical protein
MRSLRRLAVLVLLLTSSACGIALEPARPPPTITGTPSEIVARYYDAQARICETGVTRESVALYHAVGKLWDAQPTGGGRGSNFGGARDPELAWHACVQSPGWQ